jgi:hypothetical protein
LSDFDRDKLAVIFSRQHGIVARRQVLACAMTSAGPGRPRRIGNVRGA